MSQVFYLTSLLAALLLGVAASRLLRPVPTRFLRRITAAVLYVLILAMGFRIGRTEEAVRRFGQIGLQGLLYAAATIAGTILVLYAMFRLFQRPAGRSATPGAVPGSAPTAPSPPKDSPPATNRHGRPARRLRGVELKSVADPLRLVAVLAAGVLAGHVLPILPGMRPEAVITWILYGLLFLIGIALARSGLRLRELLDHSLWILPVGTAVGTLLGGGALALLLGQRLGSGLALAAGFGRYSLSGVLLIELDGPALGATAFLANMFREALALVLIPLMARSRHPYVAIGVAGATSMDVTLPLIEASCGPRSVPFAVASGAVVSTAVPILVPLVYSIG